MPLPFTPGQFFAVIREYNEAVWPAQYALLLVALAAVALLPLRRPWAGVVQRRLVFEPGLDARSAVGAALVVFALLVYPAWSTAAGHSYPELPTRRGTRLRFGAPS